MPISKMCTGDDDDDNDDNNNNNNNSNNNNNNSNNKTDLTLARLSMESVHIHVYLVVASQNVSTRRFA